METDITTIRTGEGIEVFENAICEYLQQYIDERKIENMSKEPQSKWNAALMYIHKNYFKLHPNILKSEYRLSNTYDLDKVNEVCDIYINLCYEFDKEISILGFSKLTGIAYDTIYQWGAESSRASTSASDIYKKLNCEREESLSNMLISGGKRNPVGLLGALNRHYGWNMGQPRGNSGEQKQSIEQIQQKYLTENPRVIENKELPKADF